MSKKIGNLPANINIMNPVPNKDAKSISKLIRNNGKISGYQLSDGTILSKSEGRRARQAGRHPRRGDRKPQRQRIPAQPAGRLGVEQPRRSAEHERAQLRITARKTQRKPAAGTSRRLFAFSLYYRRAPRTAPDALSMYGGQTPSSASCRPDRSSCPAALQS